MGQLGSGSGGWGWFGWFCTTARLPPAHCRTPPTVLQPPTFYYQFPHPTHIPPSQPSPSLPPSPPQHVFPSSPYMPPHHTTRYHHILLFSAFPSTYPGYICTFIPFDFLFGSSCFSMDYSAILFLPTSVHLGDLTHDPPYLCIPPACLPLLLPASLLHGSCLFCPNALPFLVLFSILPKNF